MGIRLDAITVIQLFNIAFIYPNTANMTTLSQHPLSQLGPIHPPKLGGIRAEEVKARHVKIEVKDPLDHEAPAILHEPRDYDAAEVGHAAVILISGAGGGVSGPSGIPSRFNRRKNIF